jgi:hypothetical protein
VVSSFFVIRNLTKKERRKYMKIACIQDIYKCDTCKSALDEHGRSCRHGMLFPLLLLMGNFKRCMNYEFDAEKVKLQLQKKEASKYSPDKDGIYRGEKCGRCVVMPS